MGTTKTGDKRVLAVRHDSRRYLKRHPPRRSAPPKNLVALVARVQEDYRRITADITRRVSGYSNKSGRRGPSAEAVLLSALPGGPTGDAYQALSLTMRSGAKGKEAVFCAARKLWIGGADLEWKRDMESRRRGVRRAVGGQETEIHGLG